ncbi:MAG: hypothetical protein CVV64_02085 [Candidatus Wallbacteria bacterium HGW-Wallbacteria-1]|jgi:hypothetical protein|uniref:SMP-30/Gluconolactonase/LRE-like region domain-containing protein n=1 Tax=Candidatus Wallbacteria bacterium HGW-Wallbacteria-1 TaxID=2013854 RepID=A0A2N1PV63_9BACT|nr:MAG: hypothetical protein CVV64_02085 [Candidatus Wallbacteria bacterium HGW-Wallbacteria-1]
MISGHGKLTRKFLIIFRVSEIMLLLYIFHSMSVLASVTLDRVVSLDRTRFWGRPGKIALDREHQLYVVDPEHSAVLAFDSQGKFRCLIDPANSGGLLREPGDLKMYRDNLWILDRGRGVVLGLDRDLNPLVEIRVPAEFFTHPLELSSMDIDAGGRFYVSNSSSGLVGRFNGESQPDRNYTFRASSRGLWDAPTSIGVSNDGQVLLFDWKSRRTVVLDDTGAVKLVRDQLAADFEDGASGSGKRHSRPALVSVAWRGRAAWFCDLGLGTLGCIDTADGLMESMRVPVKGPWSPGAMSISPQSSCIAVMDALSCRVAIVRMEETQSESSDSETPGLTRAGSSATEDDSGGNGYSLSPLKVQLSDDAVKMNFSVKADSGMQPVFSRNDIYLSINGQEVEIFNFHQSGENAILTIDSANLDMKGFRITLLTRWRGIIRRATWRFADPTIKDHKGHGQ